MSKDPSAQSGPGAHPGFVWAALLFGIAAVIGAVAMLLWVVKTTQPAVLTGQPAVAPSPTALAPVPGLPTDAPATVAPEPAVASPSPVGVAGGGGLIEDWSSYPDDAALAQAFERNVAWTTNQITLTRLSGLASPQGPAGVAVAYVIAAPAPTDYVGFERDLTPAQDWRPFKRLSAWVQTTDRSARQLVLQFQEATGEVWRHRVALEDLPLDGPLLVPLAPAAWEWADWSAPGNQRLDLDQVNHFGVFVGHSGPGSGELRLGSLTLQ